MMMGIIVRAHSLFLFDQPGHVHRHQEIKAFDCQPGELATQSKAPEFILTKAK